jgi:hypothetical protein
MGPIVMGSTSKRPWPSGARFELLGQSDAKSPASHDRVEARGCLGVGGTNERGQKQAGEKARSKSDGRLDGRDGCGPAVLAVARG